jgi:hypothetical protein
MMFGGSTPQLQRLALQLVSQCVSSSGCERNWSTFVLLHTKVHNRLTHKKLNKLVYVNYNLWLRHEDVSNRRDDDEGDIIVHLGQLNFYDEKKRCGNGWNMVDQTGSQFLMRRMKTVTFLSRPNL